MLADGLLFSRDVDTGDVILSASAGKTQGAFTSGPAPAVDGDNAYMVSGGQMTAVKQSGLGTTAWQRSPVDFDRSTTSPLGGGQPRVRGFVEWQRVRR